MKAYGLCVLVLFAVFRHSTTEECLGRDYDGGSIVCVCNADHCDTIDPIKQVDFTEYLTYESNKDGLRFSKTVGTFSNTSDTSENEIIVDSNTEYQEIHGWGGAFTDAAGINIVSLNETIQDKLLNSYFSDEGIEYSLCRVPIGGTDFSTRGYSYHDTNKDKTLSNFTLAPEDYEYKIPIIQKALSLSGERLKLVASAWVAPKWMKLNGAYAGILGFLKSDMYQTWADYFVKFLENYKQNNISMWGITTGNEPSLAFLPEKIPSVAWLPSQMRSFIRKNLGPTLKKSSFSDLKIITLDDQRFFLPWLVDLLFINEEVKDYVDGISVHWYWDAVAPSKFLTQTHDKYPNKFIIAAEASAGTSILEKDVILGSWERGEKYVSSIIEDISHWVTAWIDWNIALDLTGGPTFINNNVDSNIIVNATAQEFYKQPTFYAIGHFSKFVPRGSVRIDATSSNSDISLSAFKRPDGGIVLVILNKKNNSKAITIKDERRGNINLEISARSFTTVIYW